MLLKYNIRKLVLKYNFVEKKQRTITISFNITDQDFRELCRLPVGETKCSHRTLNWVDSVLG